MTKLNAIWIFLSKIFRFFKGIVYNYFAKIIIPPKKSGVSDPDSIRSVDLDPDSGYGFRIRIPDSDSGFWIPDSRFGFRIRIPDSYSGFGIHISESGLRIPDSDSRFGIRIRIQEGKNDSQK